MTPAEAAAAARAVRDTRIAQRQAEYVRVRIHHNLTISEASTHIGKSSSTGRTYEPAVAATGIHLELHRYCWCHSRDSRVLAARQATHA